MTDLSARERIAVLEMDSEQGLVDVKRNGDIVSGSSELPGGISLQLNATGLRRQHTGIHARLEIALAPNRVLAYTVCNIERDEDRVRLANSAGKRLGGEKGRGEQIKARLDEFCALVWQAWVATDEGWWLQPNEDRSPPQWLLEPYMLQNAGTILYGPPGAGKSWIALLWTIGLTHGWGHAKFWHSADDRAPVLFINLERAPESLAKRTYEVCNAIGVEPRPVLSLNARGRTLSDIWDAGKRTVEREGVGLVVVDSLSRTGSGDLNDNQDANRAMDALNSLSKTWLTLGHTPRGDTTHVFGSQMHDAAADVCVRLTSAEGGDEDKYRLGIQLEVTKANDVRKARASIWALEFDDIGLSDIQKATTADFPDLAPVVKTLADRVTEYLENEGSATVQDIAKSLEVSRSYVSGVLKGRRFVCLESGGGRGKQSKYGIATIVEPPKDVTW